MSNHAKVLKDQLLENVRKNHLPWLGLMRQSSFIFDEVKHNFHPDSYQAIIANPLYKKRIAKIHSHFDDGTLEMQSLNSSDALLMNIFCHPQILGWKGVSVLLSINPNDSIEFGHDPGFANETKGHKTEIDMKIGNHIFEAKLTENDFTSTNISTAKRYKSFTTIFDEKQLQVGKKVRSYQLIRNILAAYDNDCKFTLLVDERRTDLIREFYVVKDAIKDFNFKKIIKFVTFQEIAMKSGKDLKSYLSKKYFYGI